MKVKEIYQWINERAPFDTQLDYDNSGLLVGSAEQEVSGILFALDATEAVVAEAQSLGANLLITHHPLMFSPRRRLTDEDREGRILLQMARAHLSLISAHTCLDMAEGGINDALAAACGLQNVFGSGFVRVGQLPQAMNAQSLSEYLSSALHTVVRLMGDPDQVITKLGLCSGAGGEEWMAARELGAEAFLSGEIKHHIAIEMSNAGIPAFECGHYATELPGIFALADALQNYLNQIKYRMDIFKSVVNVYSSHMP